MSVTNFIQTYTQEEIINSYRQLPLLLGITDIARFLGISRSSAYKVADTDGFPKKKMPGLDRVAVPKKAFFDWYISAFELSGLGMEDNADSEDIISHP